MALPSFVKIVEARMRITTAPGAGARSEFDRRFLAAPPLHEMWICELALAPMRAADLPAWQAWVEQFDGRTGDVDLEAGPALSPQPAASLVLAASVAPMASEITIDVSGAAIPAGTLITIGAQDGTQQLVEVLEPATVGTARTVAIAPRIRGARAAGVAVAVGAAAIGRFRLASDAEGLPALVLDRGLAALTLVERV